MNVNLNKKNDTEIRYFLEYYQRVFAKLHVELYESGYSVDASHHIRSRYWRLVPDGKYSSIRSVELANQYLKIVEEEIKNNISEHSLCYWLHLYRRLRPGPIGPDTRPMTIGYVRLVLEASFQKGGQTMTRTLADDLAYTAADGSAGSLKGRALL